MVSKKFRYIIFKGIDFETMMALQSDTDCNVLERQVKHELGVRNTEETQQKEIKKVCNWEAKNATCWFVFFLPLLHKWFIWCGKVFFFFFLSSVGSLLKTINNFGDFLLIPRVHSDALCLSLPSNLEYQNSSVHPTSHLQPQQLLHRTQKRNFWLWLSSTKSPEPGSQ